MNLPARKQRENGTFLPSANSKLQSVPPHSILDRYLDGEEDSPQIAKTLGVTPAGLSWYLLHHAQDAWREAQVARAIVALEKAEKKMGEEQCSPLDLARNRELLKAAQWRLEKLAPKLFGNKVEVAQTNDGVTEDLHSLVRRIAFTLKMRQDEPAVIDVPSETVQASTE